MGGRRLLWYEILDRLEDSPFPFLITVVPITGFTAWSFHANYVRLPVPSHAAELTLAVTVVTLHCAWSLHSLIRAHDAQARQRDDSHATWSMVALFALAGIVGVNFLLFPLAHSRHEDPWPWLWLPLIGQCLSLIPAYFRWTSRF